MITLRMLLTKLTPQGIRMGAGFGKMDSSFEYINVQEFPLRSERIRPGGLILTTLASFENSDMIFGHLSWLMTRDVRGIGISEILIGQVPEEVLEFCIQHEFPLLIIPGPIPYSEVYKAYHELLLEESTQMSKKIEDINLSLMNVVASEESYEKSLSLLINTMGKHLRTTIIYMNQLLGVEGIWQSREVETDRIIQAVREKILTGESENDAKESMSFQVESEYGPFEFIYYPIINGQDLYGYLIVGLGNHFSLLEQSIVKHGKTAILLVAVKNKAMEKYLKNEKIIQLEAILNSIKRNDNENDLLPAFQKNSQLHILATKEFNKLNSIFEEIHRHLNSIDPHPLVWIYEQTIVYMASEPLQKDFIHKIIRKHTQLILGMSEYSSNQSTADIIKKYKQALISVKRGMKREIQVNDWNDVGIDGFLLGLADNPIGIEKSRKLLQPLIDHDQRENSELLKTLTVYLVSFLNLKESAEKLFIHRNTVKYRIKKIEEIYSGTNFADVDIFHLFLTAIRIFELKNDEKGRECC